MNLINILNGQKGDWYSCGANLPTGQIDVELIGETTGKQTGI